MISQEVALQVIQQAICALAGWAEAKLPEGCQLSKEPRVTEAVDKAKKILSPKKLFSSEKTEISYLELLFDAVKLSEGNERNYQHYCPQKAIEASDDSYPSIPYPLTEPPHL